MKIRKTRNGRIREDDKKKIEEEKHERSECRRSGEKIG